jgi:hypothetical protein
LWYSQVVDAAYGGSAYPNRYGWNQGIFGGWSAWTQWQFSFQSNNSSARFGFAAGDLDLDLTEALVNLTPPTTVSQFAVHSVSTAITATWSTGETDVRGYYVTISGQTTATVATGVGSTTFVGLIQNSTYAVSAVAFDAWEISQTPAVATTSTQGTVNGFKTLLCFKL